jgi:hypothetical protein
MLVPELLSDPPFAWLVRVSHSVQDWTGHRPMKGCGKRDGSANPDPVRRLGPRLICTSVHVLSVISSPLTVRCCTYSMFSVLFSLDSICSPGIQSSEAIHALHAMVGFDMHAPTSVFTALLNALGLRSQCCGSTLALEMAMLLLPRPPSCSCSCAKISIRWSRATDFTVELNTSHM